MVLVNQGVAKWQKWAFFDLFLLCFLSIDEYDC